MIKFFLVPAILVIIFNSSPVSAEPSYANWRAIYDVLPKPPQVFVDRKIITHRREGVITCGAGECVGAEGRIGGKAASEAYRLLTGTAEGDGRAGGVIRCELKSIYEELYTALLGAKCVKR